MFCRNFKEEFELSPELHYVYYSHATYVWCPVCMAHGKRSIHLVMETWVPAFEREAEETATVSAVAV